MEEFLGQEEIDKLLSSVDDLKEPQINDDLNKAIVKLNNSFLNKETHIDILLNLSYVTYELEKIAKKYNSDLLSLSHFHRNKGAYIQLCLNELEKGE